MRPAATTPPLAPLRSSAKLTEGKSRSGAQAAFFTRPARMHAAQTRICFFAPFTNPRTRRKFGFHRRRLVLFAWLITFPKCGALPQNSHFSAIFLPASVFIWAWISCSNCHKTKLLILADPPPPAKCAFCIALHRFCILCSSAGPATCFRMVLRDNLAHRSSLLPPSVPVLSYGFRTRAAYQQPLQSY